MGSRARLNWEGNEDDPVFVLLYKDNCFILSDRSIRTRTSDKICKEYEGIIAVYMAINCFLKVIVR